VIRVQPYFLLQNQHFNFFLFTFAFMKSENSTFTYLDFEAPIQKLYEQIDSLQEMEKKTGVSMSDKINETKTKIEEVKNEIQQNLTTWQKVQLSRHPNRPYTLQYIDLLTENFVELHGDRNVKDDKAIVGGLATIDGQSVMIVGHQKGANTKQRQFRNFGMPNPEGYRKAMRLMKMAEKFNIPVVTFIDTPGAFPGIEAEDRGQAEAIARNLFEMSILKVPVLCYVIGEGASGGALGIGVGDKVFMLENTWFSVISPESCSSILWRSWEHKEKAAEALKLTATDNLNNKIIDGIVPEPLGGAHYNPEAMAAILKKHILDNIAILDKMNPTERISQRIQKYEAMGSSEVA
jgi:acetyl-CoA carboxylase carboxyl transferase subunit alpha